LLIGRHIKQLRLIELHFNFISRLIDAIAGTIVSRNLNEKELGAPIRACRVMAVFAFLVTPPHIAANTMGAVSALVFVFGLHFAPPSAS
jgi:hypothetical protein